MGRSKFVPKVNNVERLVATVPPCVPLSTHDRCPPPVPDMTLDRTNAYQINHPTMPTGHCQQPGVRPWSASTQITRESPVMEAYALLRRLFQSYQVVMISFTYCKFCKSLAQRFESHGIPFYKLEADLLPNMKEFMDTAENLSGIRTAPQIYVNGQFVGDSSTTTKLLESGEFQKMIW
ncbi:Hypothetical protein NTJ_02339 [Nesidiocoris tenuis]|nr:Hypothetical protein NTJ_02339 [Nesidiocoris tenuis]